MIDFERNRRSVLELPLTPLIDVTFILIIFFMLTTSFMKMESLELLLPSATQTEHAAKDINMAHIYVRNDEEITYGRRPVDPVALRNTLKRIFATFPDQRVVVMVSKDVSLQTMINIMDMVHMSGGKNVFVREWEHVGTRP